MTDSHEWEHSFDQVFATSTRWCVLVAGDNLSLL